MLRKKPATIIFITKKWALKFFTERLENLINSPKGTEYIIIFVGFLPKGLFKTGSGIKYIDNLSQLRQRLYTILAKEKTGKNNFHKEKMGIIDHFSEQLDSVIDSPKCTEYIIRFISCLPKGVFKTGSGILNTLLNKLGNVVPEMHVPGYKYCGPFTKLEERLARGDDPINKMDAGCQKHDIFNTIIGTQKKNMSPTKNWLISLKKGCMRAKQLLVKKLKQHL